MRTTNPKRILARRAGFGVVTRNVFNKLIPTGKGDFKTVVRGSATFVAVKAVVVGIEIAFTVHVIAVARVDAEIFGDDVFCAGDTKPSR